MSEQFANYRKFELTVEKQNGERVRRLFVCAISSRDKCADAEDMVRCIERFTIRDRVIIYAYKAQTKYRFLSD